MTFRYESVTDRFRAVVARSPHAAALEDSDGRTISYTELESRAAAVGADLRDRGLGREDVVAIAVEKSPDFVAAVLGCWWAGCAYVPIDPALPAERRAFLLADSGAKLVLGSVPRGAGGAHVALQHGDVAWVIYTSGSTGAPKGVVVEHRGLVNLLDAQIEAFRLRAGARSLFLLSTSFDASISDLGTALLSGATLVFPSEQALSSTAGLERELASRRIIHVDLPPSLLARLDPEGVPSVETIVIGGEPCAPEVVRRWAARHRVVNVYGPTEATICTSLCVCGTDWTRPLLGQPTANVEYVVEDGELLIGGVALARGYRNRPDLTADRFIERDGRRLYRTGDRVRVLEGGELEFAGRIDRQLKVNGRLVAPEEIELALRACAGVEDAAVVLSEGTLAALVVGRAGTEATSAIRAELARRLPSWMVPARIEFVDALIRGESGKIEYARLVARASELPRRAPEKPREIAIARIWRRILNVPAVGLDDDFVALGGDSLDALEVAALAEREGIPLVASSLLSLRTLEAVARSTTLDARPAESLRAEVRALSLELTCREAQLRAATPESILLTGAAGFLGSALLGELLTRTTARVTCLVRATGDAAAAVRVTVPECARGRVRVLAADLSRSRFGLSEATFRELAEDVDTVHHCAAEVNVVKPFEALRASNLDAVRELVAFLATGRAKHLHAASTLSVFVSTDCNAGVAREDDDLAATRVVYGGYAQTKWAAEVFLRETRGRAGPVTHYRFGLITGNSTTGRGAPRDFLATFVRGLAAVGCVPEDALGLAFDVTPVDFAAAAMAHLSLHVAPQHDRTFHVANARGATLGELVEAMASEGLDLRRVQTDVFENRLKSLEFARSVAPALLALCRAASDASAFERHRAIDLFQTTDIRFDRTELQRGLEGSGLACPPIDRALLAGYVRAAMRERA